MLLRLAYLGVANVFALLRLLPVSNEDKDAEILALRHQITVLERRLGRDRVRFAPSDRVFLAALLHRLPRGVLRRARLLVRPDTVLHWHRDLVSRRHAARSRPKRAGRPRTVRSIRVLVLRRARENPGWGYRRIQGELLVVGVQVAAPTVWEILKEPGIGVALTGVRIPRMNALMERWVQTCRRELLDRTLVWNQRHLLHALREFDQHYNSHRPYQGIADARPLHPLPPPITDPDAIAHLDIRRRDRLGGILHQYQHTA
ncbi:transposase [Streptomyces sp. NBC_00882]|uniref:integrase core domain-containing protein n=1 Tax=Streptomyces TaxID=1883 RepID=UPI00386A6B8A|nr:transposase [Streptomyces sp. NBC_00882]WSZ63759.1 transposase [Streptomyces canus]